MKHILQRTIENLHEEDLNLLKDAILNSKIKIPYTLGESNVFNNLKKTIMQDELNINKINRSNLSCIIQHQRDINSNYIEIYYNNTSIAEGHLNNKTNWAHLTVKFEVEELENYLIEAVEQRKILMQ